MASTVQRYSEEDRVGHPVFYGIGQHASAVQTLQQPRDLMEIGRMLRPSEGPSLLIEKVTFYET